MADPKLVAYLRKNLPQFGSAALREKLLEEGLSAEEIDDALAVANKPPRKKTPLGMYVAFAGIAITAVAAFLALDNSGKPAGGPPAAAVSGDPVPSGGGDSVAAPPAAAGSKPSFMGHYGYVLKLPEGYTTQSAFKDLGNSTEVVYLFPEKTDPTNFGNEGLYAQLGILRLEASPRRIPQGTVGYDSLKAGITTTLTRRGDTYTTRDLTVGGMPAFIVSITQPFPLAQAFILGSKVMYVLTGGAENPLFLDALSSLNEVAPHDRPGG